MLDACSSLKRSWELGILPFYSQGRSNGEWLSPHPNLCSQWLWPGSFSYQCFDSGMVETSSWGSPMRSLNISSVIQSSLSPSPGKSWELWVSLWLYGAEPRIGTLASEGHIFPTSFDVADFVFVLGYVSIWTGIHISHKGSWFLSCWFVLPWGKQWLASCSAVFLTSSTRFG